MKFDLILETMHGIPSANFALILVMTLSAALLVSHILKIGVYTTIVAVPALLLSGIFMHSAFVVHDVMISPDKASNTAIAASIGFSITALSGLIAYRIYSYMNDDA